MNWRKKLYETTMCLQEKEWLIEKVELEAEIKGLKFTGDKEKRIEMLKDKLSKVGVEDNKPIDFERFKSNISFRNVN